MKKLFSIFFIMMPLLLTGCKPSDPGNTPSEEEPGGEVTPGGGEEEPGEDEDIVIPGVDDYEEWIDEWSEEGHLYIHYNRPGASESDYNKYAVWIWPSAPLDQEGSLWGATRTETQEKFNVMSTSWMTDIGGSGLSKDNTGKILDIDLTNENIIGGENGTKVSFEGATRVGFLIVDTTTMGGGSHWTSDGGADMFINDFQTHWRPESKSMHIFCTQGSVDEFKFESGIEPTPNVTVTDTTGQYVSEADIDSSVEIPGISKTSEKFKDVGVGYQIFVASYRDSNGDGLGDIRGIIDALPYLKELGVEALWLTPVQESGSYHAYDTIDFYSIDPKFGTEKDYRELIYKAHENGMYVLMDLVLNHTSKNNIWFKKSQKAVVETDPITGDEINYRDLYHWKFEGQLVKKYQNGTWVDVPVEEHGDWYKDGESKYYYYGKFGSGMPELNFDCELTRDLVKDLAKYWLGFGLDGFRLDAVKHIYMRDEAYSISNDDIIVVDTGTKTAWDNQIRDEVTKEYDYSSVLTKNLNFWKDFAIEVKSTYPDAFLVGENFDGYGNRIAPYYQALDSQFDFSYYYHTQEWGYGSGGNNFGQTQSSETYDSFMTSNEVDVYINDTVLKFPGGSRSDFINSAFTSNHDILRSINHINDNASEITGTTKEINRAKVAAAMTILNPGISWIYYGDELGMSSNTNNHEELYTYDNNLDLWYRQPYIWGDESVIVDYSFNSYKVEWDSYNQNLESIDEQKASNDNDMYDVYKKLIEIKKLYGKNAKFRGYSSGNNDVMHFVAETDSGDFGIYINVGTNNSKYDVYLDDASEYWFVNNGINEEQINPYGICVKKFA